MNGTKVHSWIPSVVSKWEDFCGYGTKQQQNVSEAFENLHKLFEKDGLLKQDSFNPVRISHMKCMKCQKLTSHIDNINNSIIINSSSTHNGLSSLFSTEILDGKNSVYCEECKEKCCTACWEEMISFPEVLALSHECTDPASSPPSRTLLIETDMSNKRSFCKGFANEKDSTFHKHNKETTFYHFIGQVLHKQFDNRNGHHIAVVERKKGIRKMWITCNDDDINEFDSDNWAKSWKDLFSQGYIPSLSFYVKEKSQSTQPSVQFGGSSSSSSSSQSKNINNSSTETTPPSSFITPLHCSTSIPQLSSSITSPYGLEALKEKRKKTGIFSPNEKRLIFKPKTKLWKEFSEETNIKVSLSHFYKLTTNFSKAKRRTDLCGMCEKLNYLENKLKSSQNKNGLSEAEFHTLKLLRQHRLVAEMQRKHYQSTVDNLKEGEAVFVFDFKEKWKLPIRKNQLQQEFFNYQQ
eukprot:MONOS_16737.1-p1 / transcript=MONOS_16737.1 / gene=MONOS_16737 / organism=Monocercomonoides_exilis_PA203 / gene_product=unspecified product / transcript_product=unspecified product / location=Mono_scaffold02108:5-1417(-) / protein_length=463 / sequence_SO=supercontig / SO=protein_coding / is_pseudo=false